MRKLVVFGLSIALAGCASVQEQQSANRALFEETIPVCRGEASCKMGWAVARNWVIQNCGMKIQNITDTYIETYGSAGNSTALACRVMGEPRGADSWAMVIKTGCANIFGCVPDAWESAIRFNREVGLAVAQGEISAQPEADATP